MNVTGACHCGEIKFRARVDPTRVGICHCTDCQIFSGSAFRVSVLVDGVDFELLDGRPATYEKTAESGARRELMFCGTCGTHLYGRTPGAGRDFYSVRGEPLAERGQLRPVVQIWCQSEVDWLGAVSALPRMDGQKF